MPNEREEKLIERITAMLEEYGMPKFQDHPAKGIIQIIKDSGFWKAIDQIGDREITLDREYLAKIISIQVEKDAAVYGGAIADAIISSLPTLLVVKKLPNPSKIE